MSSERIFDFSGLPTMVGSLPHKDPEAACSLVAKYLPQLPAWPQLPHRTQRENMYFQCSEGFPGLITHGDRIYVGRSQDLEPAIEQFYDIYLKQELDKIAISREYAEGLYSFAGRKWENAICVKGQITGPVTWGMVITDEKQRPIIYDDTLADVIGKHICLKAAWMQRMLRQVSDNTIIILDEPYMTSVGSAFFSISPEHVVTLLDQALAGLDTGYKGLHCCGNTDWSLMLKSSLDILSFDAYNYGYTISLYPDEVSAFLQRGGVLAWGIVGRDESILEKENANSILDRLIDEMSRLEIKGVTRHQILNQCLLTPSCGLEPVSEDAAAWALELLAEVSTKFRQKYLKER